MNQESAPSNQVLHPVEVPWMISPSTPYLLMTVPEDPSIGPTEVRLLAFLGTNTEGSAKSANGVSSSVNIVNSPWLNPECKVNGLQKVLLSFTNCQYVRRCPGVSDSESFDTSKFQLAGSLAISPRSLDWDKYWKTTGNCPNPRVYEVANSHWLDELMYPESGLRHFVIEGHDAYFELIADGFTWHRLQPDLAT